MIRGTTPTYTLTIEGHDLTDKTVYVTLKIGKNLMTLTNDRLSVVYSQQQDKSLVEFTLTQEETLSFKVGTGDVQVRFINSHGTASATDIGKIEIDKVLLERVIEYGGEIESEVDNEGGE